MIRLMVFMLCIFVSFCTMAIQPPHSWKSVGKADLDVLWMKIYQAELLTPNGKFQNFKGPMLLQIIYKRNIKSNKLVEATRNQIASFTSSEQLTIWLETLQKMWPDITKGDELAFMIDCNSSGHFFHNRSWIGSFDDPAFGYAFAQIWLSEKSSYPKLARKLRGE